MHCRTCGYALWNLSRPACPECGQAFSLRSYRFKLGSVTFACPHCQHEHSGKTDNGLPTADSILTCAGCGETIPVDALRVVIVGSMADAVGVSADLVPWEEPGQDASIRAWRQTCRLAMRQPTELADRMRPPSVGATAGGFALFTYFFVAGIQFVSFGLLLTIGMVGGDLGQILGAIIAATFGAAVIAFYAALIFVVILTIASWTTHGLCRLMGGQASFDITLQCTMYAQAPMCFAAVPLLGVVLVPIWQIYALILSGRMLARRHRIHPLPAMLAGFALPATIILFMGMLLTSL